MKSYFFPAAIILSFTCIIIGLCNVLYRAWWYFLSASSTVPVWAATWQCWNQPGQSNATCSQHHAWPAKLCERSVERRTEPVQSESLFGLCWLLGNVALVWRAGRIIYTQLFSQSFRPNTLSMHLSSRVLKLC